MFAQRAMDLHCLDNKHRADRYAKKSSRLCGGCGYKYSITRSVRSLCQAPSHFTSFKSQKSFCLPAVGHDSVIDHQVPMAGVFLGNGMHGFNMTSTAPYTSFTPEYLFIALVLLLVCLAFPLFTILTELSFELAGLMKEAIADKARPISTSLLDGARRYFHSFVNPTTLGRSVDYASKASVNLVKSKSSNRQRERSRCRVHDILLQVFRGRHQDYRRSHHLPP
jgi:hypothetical protein